MTIKKNKIYLFCAGTILGLVGFYIGFSPADYLTQLFGKIEFNSDSLSELRGMGGSLFILGLFVLGGAFINRIEDASLIISVLIFGGFSAFRFLSILLDGIPSQSILIALTIEVVFAVIAIPLLLSQQHSSLATSKETKPAVRS
jgi:hypothetical protein